MGKRIIFSGCQSTYLYYFEWKSGECETSNSEPGYLGKSPEDFRGFGCLVESFQGWQSQT